MSFKGGWNVHPSNLRRYMVQVERSISADLARVVELADTLDLGSNADWRAGSSPVLGIIRIKAYSDEPCGFSRCRGSNHTLVHRWM